MISIDMSKKKQNKREKQKKHSVLSYESAIIFTSLNESKRLNVD